jgi:hypothetical protein
MTGFYIFGQVKINQGRKVTRPSLVLKSLYAAFSGFRKP